MENSATTAPGRSIEKESRVQQVARPTNLNGSVVIKRKHIASRGEMTMNNRTSSTIALTLMLVECVAVSSCKTAMMNQAQASASELNCVRNFFKNCPEALRNCDIAQAKIAGYVKGQHSSPMMIGGKIVPFGQDGLYALHLFGLNLANDTREVVLSWPAPMGCSGELVIPCRKLDEQEKETGSQLVFFLCLVELVPVDKLQEPSTKPSTGSSALEMAGLRLRLPIDCAISGAIRSASGELSNCVPIHVSSQGVQLVARASHTHTCMGMRLGSIATAMHQGRPSVSAAGEPFPVRCQSNSCSRGRGHSTRPYSILRRQDGGVTCSRRAWPGRRD